MLMLAHPEVAYRPCDLCKKFMFNHKTGELLKNKDGSPTERPAHSKVPCEFSKTSSIDVRKRACPKVSPDAGIELSEKNRNAYEHYRECRAVSQFPDDPIVRRNAAIILSLEEAHQQAQMHRAMASTGRM